MRAYQREGEGGGASAPILESHDHHSHPPRKLKGGKCLEQRPERRSSEESSLVGPKRTWGWSVIANCNSYPSLPPVGSLDKIQ